jgi:hypothetical protein
VLVRFSDKAEFLEELRKDGPPTKIVRVTLTWQPFPKIPTIQAVSIVAGYVNAAGDLIQLQRYIGDDWGHGAGSSDDTRSKAKALVEELEVAISAAGYESRNGMIEG